MICLFIYTLFKENSHFKIGSFFYIRKIEIILKSGPVQAVFVKSSYISYYKQFLFDPTRIANSNICFPFDKTPISKITFNLLVNSSKLPLFPFKQIAFLHFQITHTTHIHNSPSLLSHFKIG